MDTTKDGMVIYSYGVKPPGITFKDPRGTMPRWLPAVVLL